MMNRLLPKSDNGSDALKQHGNERLYLLDQNARDEQASRMIHKGVCLRLDGDHLNRYLVGWLVPLSDASRRRKAFRCASG